MYSNVKVLIVVRDIYKTVQSHWQVYKCTLNIDVFDNLSYYRVVRSKVSRRVLENIDEDSVIDRVVVNYLVTYEEVLKLVPRFYGRVLVVKYEDGDKQHTLTQLSEFIGIEFRKRVDKVELEKSVDDVVKERVDRILKLWCRVS